MTQISIPSLSNKNEVLILQYQNSSDILFGTKDKLGNYDLALAHAGKDSIYAKVRNTRDLRAIFGEMAKGFPQGKFKLSETSFREDEKMNVVSIATDKPDVYLSAIETKEELIGIQVWDKDWKETREIVPVIWLGYADESCESAKTLRKFWQECRYNIFTAWEDNSDTAKWAQREVATLSKIQRPVLRTTH